MGPFRQPREGSWWRANGRLKTEAPAVPMEPRKEASWLRRTFGSVRSSKGEETLRHATVIDLFRSPRSDFEAAMAGMPAPSLSIDTTRASAADAAADCVLLRYKRGQTRSFSGEPSPTGSSSDLHATLCSRTESRGFGGWGGRIRTCECRYQKPHSAGPSAPKTADFCGFGYPKML